MVAPSVRSPQSAWSSAASARSWRLLRNDVVCSAKGVRDAPRRDSINVAPIHTNITPYYSAPGNAVARAANKENAAAVSELEAQ
eukprot:1628186-Pleurochrysis_carterae.AAC.1